MYCHIIRIACSPGTVYVNFEVAISLNNWSCKLQNMLNPIFDISIYSNILCVLTAYHFLPPTPRFAYSHLYLD